MLENIVKKFFPYHLIIRIQAFGNGHINDTYKVELRSEAGSYILQRINTNVFPEPQILVDNHLQLQKQLQHRGHSLCIANLIPTMVGEYLNKDEKGNYWRMMSFIPNSYSIDTVNENWQALEAGKGFGWFAKVCSNQNTSLFKEAIPNFHSLSFRIGQFNKAINENILGRLDLVTELIEFYKKREASLLSIEGLIIQGVIPQRVLHNDTKINNLLFRDNKVIAVVDLDTLGPGNILYDYGDALRSCANTAAEDEKDLNRVEFNINTFRCFTQGYLSQTRTILTNQEEKNLYLAPTLMTYIMGIRFLTDYLNGDIYYKTAYTHHNLVRSQVHRKLLEDIEFNEEKIKSIISGSMKSIPELFK